MSERVRKIRKSGKPATSLETECARLRSELARLTAERDGYLKSLHFMLRKDVPDPPFDAEELATMVEVDLAEIVQYVRQEEKNHSCPKPRAAVQSLLVREKP
jgi:hypothetical protein